MCLLSLQSVSCFRPRCFRHCLRIDLAEPSDYRRVVLRVYAWEKEGTYIGFACGLLLDIFGSGILGFYALLYMYIGYINGCFRKMFYPEDLKAAHAFDCRQ